jgi:hypothetical protein
MNLFVMQPWQKKISVSFGCVLFFFLVSSTAFLHGQSVNNYLLIKTNFFFPNSNQGTVSWQWIASNNNPKSGNFYILENVPSGYEIQTISSLNQYASSPRLNPSLPMTGPGALTIGPFPIAANTSVTFQVAGNVSTGSSQGQKYTAGESFFLLTDSQMRAKNSKSVIDENPQEASSSGSLIQSLVAAPNISKGFEPINFLLNLNSPAQVNLTLYTIAGEKVFSTQVQEGQGKSALSWNVQNDMGQPVASGLYIYVLKAIGKGYDETRTGKALIVH